MKRLVHVPINAASDLGTTFYKATLKQIQQILQDDDANVWIQYALEVQKFDAIDFKHYLQGGVIGDTAYFLETDGEPIAIGDEFVDPEEVLGLYSEAEFSQYVKEASDKQIIDWVGTYEVKIPDMDKGAMYLLGRGFSFHRLMEDAQELQHED